MKRSWRENDAMTRSHARFVLWSKPYRGVEKAPLSVPEMEVLNVLKELFGVL